MSPAYISAIAALCGSAIGALASLATTWLAQRHQDENQRRAETNARLEQIFVEFIDLSSKAFVDALLQTSIKDPAKFVPLYATVGKLRLFASVQTVEAAEKVMSRLVEHAPKMDFQAKPAVDGNFDIVREFADSCRAELNRLEH